MKYRFDDIIRDQTSVKTGIVITHEQREYTQTTYSGGGGYIDQHGNRVGSTPVTSQTTHHHKQDIWYRDKDGNEHNLALHNVNFKVNEDQGIAVLRSNNTGTALRVVNLMTKYFWDLGHGNRRRGKAGRILGRIGIRLKAMVIATLSATPFVNLVAVLVVLFSLFKKRHFRGLYNRQNVYGVLFILSALCAFMPIADRIVDTHLMDSVIAEDSRFTASGRAVRSLATLAWSVMKPFEQLIGDELSSREELDAELATVPDAVGIVYRKAGTREKQLTSSDTVIYDRETRDMTWLALFTILSFLFMYLRSVLSDRINLGIAEALDRRTSEVINENPVTAV